MRQAPLAKKLHGGAPEVMVKMEALLTAEMGTPRRKREGIERA